MNICPLLLLLIVFIQNLELHRACSIIFIMIVNQIHQIKMFQSMTLMPNSFHNLWYTDLNKIP